MQMKFSNFMNSSVDKFHTPKNSKLAKINSLKFMFKTPYLSFCFSTLHFRLSKVAMGALSELENWNFARWQIISFNLKAGVKSSS